MRITQVVFFLLVSWLLPLHADSMDFTNAQALGDSLDEIRNSLPEAKKAAFNQALNDTLDGLAAEIGLAALAAGITASEDDVKRAQELTTKILGDNIGNLTPEALIEVKAKENAAKLLALQEKAATLEAVVNALASIEITDVSYTRMKSTFNESIFPKITFKAKNNTDKALSSLTVNVVLKSPDRQVPWQEEIIEVTVAGGVEPAETRQVVFETNPHTWDVTHFPEAAEIILTLNQVKGADKKTLWAIPKNEDDKETLKTLDQLKEKQAIYQAALEEK